MMSESIAKFDSLFRFQADPYSQDCELERADADRLAEFIAAYRNDCENDDDKSILMGLILASYDNYLCINTHSEKMWEPIREALQSDASIHQESVDDWCLWDEPEQADRDNWHRLTPIIRGIREQGTIGEEQAVAGQLRASK